jgi:hypothetical protein
VVDGVEVPTNVRIEHPVHLLPLDFYCECIKGFMWRRKLYLYLTVVQGASSSGRGLSITRSDFDFLLS